MRELGEIDMVSRALATLDLTNWLQLSDRGRGHDLVPCLDFSGGRPAAAFEDLSSAMACRRPLSGAHTNVAPAGTWLARFASCSADQR